MSTTSAYGWNIPDNTDLVKDGALAIRTLGNAIDTSMNTALGTKKAGMVLLNTTSFSGVASQSINNVFSANYDNYRAIISIDSSTSTGHGNLQFRYGTSGTPNSSTNYNNKGFFVDATVSVVDQTGAGKITFGYLQYSPTATTGTKFAIIDIINPFATKQTYAIAEGMDNFYRDTYTDVLFELTTSFTDFVIFPNANGITGSVSMYGYNK
jgi:hypothetical protein